MPIITPAYPSMCATHNITQSTMRVILKELEKANEIVQNIVAGRMTWKDLFGKHMFFTKDYKYYLSIVSGSLSKEAQQIWSGLVQSKVRRLVTGIERLDTGVKLAHPFNKGFDRIHLCKTPEEIDQVFQGDLRFHLSEEEACKTDLPKDSTDGPHLIFTTTYYVGLQLENTDGKFFNTIKQVFNKIFSSQEIGHHRAGGRFQTAMR
jgi:poly(A) polymerase